MPLHPILIYRSPKGARARKKGEPDKALSVEASFFLASLKAISLSGVVLLGNAKE